jgi:hypothetical protein
LGQFWAKSHPQEKGIAGAGSGRNRTTGKIIDAHNALTREHRAVTARMKVNASMPMENFATIKSNPADLRTTLTSAADGTTSPGALSLRRPKAHKCSP